MNPELQNKLTNLPSKPGIYQFFNDKKKFTVTESGIVVIGKNEVLTSEKK